MAALSALQRAETLAALLRHHGDKTAAARQLGIAPRTMRDRAVAIGWGGQYEEAYIPDVDELASNDEVAADNDQYEPHDDEKIHTVLALGDPHDKPGRCKKRFSWIARHAAETCPDAVISIGDWASLDSLSAHELPGSEGDAARPAFHDELESLDESQSLFNRDLPVGSIPLWHVHGNHEFRAWRAANRQPKLNGDMPARLESIFARYGWQTRPFGEFLDLFDVDFVHIPLSIMGKEMGGKNVEQAVARETIRSTVFGHTHRYNFHTACKVGQNRSIQIVNLGTSLPYGVVEKYAKMSTTGWSYCVVLLRIQNGQILSAKPYDMLELEQLYGD